MATVNFYRDMQKALLGEQKKVKVQPISSAPGTSWQVADRLLRKAVEEWEAGRKEQRDKDDLAQAMEMARAYNAPRPDYDPDEFGTDPRQILTGAEQLDAYQASLGETPTPSAGIDPNTRLAIADPSLKGPPTYEPGDEPVGDVAGLEVQKQNLINDAVRQQRSFQKENPIGMARVDQDFGDVKGPVSRKMLLALMGDENRRAAEKLKRSRELSDIAADRAFRAGESEKTRAAADARHRAATRARLEFIATRQDAKELSLKPPSNDAKNQSNLKAIRAPWDSVPLRDRGRMQISVHKAATSLLNSERKALDESNLVANRLKRFKYLNSIEETGGWMDRITDLSVDEQKREMVSIVDNLTPLMRQGLPGAASERDTAMFRGATVGLDKTRAINDNIIAGQAALNQMGKDRLAFRQEYLQVNGHLEGSEKMWISYAEANPIFDFSAPEGSYKLNKNRKTYNDFFNKSNNKVREVDF